jgi:hypothetical protein
MKEDELGEKHVQGGRRKGGQARARALAPKTRSDIARRAAIARWDPDIPEAIYGSPDRLLHLGEVELDCYVLSTEERVFSQRGMMQALALTIRGGELRRFVEQAGLARFLSEEARNALANPREFRRRGGGPLVKGYHVTLLIDICTAILDAARSDGLPKHYELARMRAEIIIRAVAKVGIIALVDEVTGYQDVRHREALQAILDRYLRREFAAWAKRFPDDFYQELFRLRGWEWEGPGKSGHAVAHSTNDLVYARIAPELLAELQKANPRENNRRKAKHHQWLTDDIGLPALERHLYAVTGLMRAADSWPDFKRMVDRALPLKDPYVDLPLFDFDKDKEPES